MKKIAIIWQKKDGQEKWQRKIHLAFENIKEAKKQLLQMLNNDYNTHYTNWGLVQANTHIPSSAGRNWAIYRYNVWTYTAEEEEAIEDMTLFDYEGLSNYSYNLLINNNK